LQATATAQHAREQGSNNDNHKKKHSMKEECTHKLDIIIHAFKVEPDNRKETE
jgi:hypothetical protein